MNESTWLSCEDPRKLLQWLPSATSDRQLRLFACAFWRWETQRRAMRTGEANQEMNRAIAYAERWAEEGTPQCGANLEFSIAYRWHPLFARHASDAAEWTIRGSSAFGRDWIGPAEQAQQVALLREIFGNPFRRTEVSPAWLAWQGGIVPNLARTVYADRSFGDLPLLADALAGAGCTEATVLDHCRSGGNHVLECWVLDLVLGKE